MQNQIPFQVMEIEPRSFHPIVLGRIDGFEVNLILDTGASRTVIDRSIAANFPVIEIESAEPFAAGINAQRISVEQVEIPSLVLGDIDFGKILAFTADLSPISQLYNEMMNFSIHGLLGCDFLEQHKASVDFETRLINLKKNDL